jgi:hypothetical protein
MHFEVKAVNNEILVKVDKVNLIRLETPNSTVASHVAMELNKLSPNIGALTTSRIVREIKRYHKIYRE